MGGPIKVTSLMDGPNKVTFLMDDPHLKNDFDSVDLIKKLKLETMTTTNIGLRDDK